MVQHGPVFYLAARLFDYEDVLILALHRIEKTSMLERAAEAPEGFTLDKWLEDGALGFGGNQTIRLVAHFYDGAGNHLLESPLAPDQNVVPLRGHDNAFRVTATVKETEQLRWWLLGFGDRVEVIQPKSLRQDIAARLQNAARRYNQRNA
jgi:predicted DNA-binding transcriptional regulator YafY